MGYSDFDLIQLLESIRGDPLASQILKALAGQMSPRQSKMVGGGTSMPQKYSGDRTWDTTLFGMGTGPEFEEARKRELQRILNMLNPAITRKNFPNLPNMPDGSYHNPKYPMPSGGQSSPFGSSPQLNSGGQPSPFNQSQQSSPFGQPQQGGNPLQAMLAKLSQIRR